MRVSRRGVLSAAAAFAVAYGCAVAERADAPSAPARPAPGAILGEAIAPAPLPDAASYLAARAARAAPVDARVAAAASAVEVLSARVAVTSHPDALRHAFQAYYAYRAAHPEQVRKPYLYFVDYGLDNRTPRGYVFDMDRLALVEGPFMVAHGHGSSTRQDGVPTRFTNRNGSASTSLGLYLTQETYAFRGKAGGGRYRSIGLRLKGLSGSFNSAARARGIVVHGAPYVTPSRAGRSEGCPAMEQDRAQRLIPMLAGGSLVFHFSPHDARWMREDPWTRLPDRLAATG